MTRSVAAEKSLDKFITRDGEIEKHVLCVETDIEEILQKLKFTEELFPDCVVMLCNATHKNFKYIGDNLTSLFGHSIQYFTEVSSEDYLAEVHSEDVAAVGACYEFMTKSVSGLDASQLLSMRFVINYRFRHASGHYVHIEDEKLVMESRKGRHIGLTLLRDVDNSKSFMGVKLQILKRIKNKFLPMNEYSPNQHAVVSAREADVLELTKVGFGNQEIADRLSISVNTVKNHKKNLFKKMQVKSSLALASHPPVRTRKGM